MTENEEIKLPNETLDNAIGVYETCVDVCKDNEDYSTALDEVTILFLEELKAYRAIGTIEEFKALKEKSVAKKVVKWADGSEHCPCCDFDNSAIGYGVCIECGQKLDWE